MRIFELFISLKKIFNFKQKIGLLILLLITFISMLLEMLGIALIIPIIVILSTEDLNKYYLISEIHKLLGNPEQITFLLYFVFFILITYLVKNLTLFFFNYWKYNFIYNLQKIFSHKLYNHYLNKNYLFHKGINSSELIRNIDQVTLFTEVINQILYIITELLLLLGIIIVLFSINPTGTLITLSFILLLSSSFYLFIQNKLKFYGEERQFHIKKKLQNLQEGFSEIKYIKLMNYENFFAEKFKFFNDNFAKFSRIFEFIQSSPRLFLEMIAVGGISILIFYMIITNQSLNIILSTLAVFGVSGFKMIPSINRLMVSSQFFLYHHPVVFTLNEELIKLNKINNNYEQKAFNFNKNIIIDSISFNYPDDKKLIIDNVSITINKNEFIGIVGSTGGGKSTFIDILMGLIEPTKGKILIDTINLNSNLRGWQKNIGYVPQQINLIDDTILNNITFGKKTIEIDHSQIEKVIMMSQLDNFIDSLPQGLNTKVGEKGMKLSGGQIQRIGIARALYNNPEILILDEPTSSLDFETEKKIIETLEKLIDKITVIAISHRKSVLSNCNKIYEVKNAKVNLIN